MACTSQHDLSRPTPPTKKKKKNLFPWAPGALASFWSQNMMHLCLGSPASKASVPDLLGTQVLGWWLICGEMVPSCLCVCVCVCVCAKSFQSCLFATPWTVPCHVPLSMEFSRPEYWNGLPCPPPGESSQPRDQTCVSYICCLGRIFTTHTTWEALGAIYHIQKSLCIRSIRCRLTRNDAQLRMFIQSQWTYKLSERA